MVSSGNKMSDRLINHKYVFCQHSFTVGRSGGREAVGRLSSVRSGYMGRGEVLEVAACGGRKLLAAQGVPGGAVGAKRRARGGAPGGRTPLRGCRHPGARIHPRGHTRDDKHCRYRIGAESQTRGKITLVLLNQGHTVRSDGHR